MEHKKMNLCELIADVVTTGGLMGILVGETWTAAIFVITGSVIGITIQLVKIFKARRAKNEKKKES